MLRTLKRLFPNLHMKVWGRRSSLLCVCKPVQQIRRKQSTVAERISLGLKDPTPGKSRLRFAVPARIARPRWRVSQARLRWVADYSSLSFARELCNESLVSSVAQADFLCLRGYFYPIPRLKHTATRSGYSRNLLTIAMSGRCVNFFTVKTWKTCPGGVVLDEYGAEPVHARLLE